MRHEVPGCRWRAFCSSGPETWGQARLDQALPDPVCSGALLQLADKRLAFVNCAYGNEPVLERQRRGEDVRWSMDARPYSGAIFLLLQLLYPCQLYGAVSHQSGLQRISVRPNLQSCAGGQTYAGIFERIHHGHVPACEAVSASLFWFSHRPIESYLPLIVLDRGADASVYGTICGFGAVMELSNSAAAHAHTAAVRYFSPIWAGNPGSQLCILLHWQRGVVFLRI